MTISNTDICNIALSDIGAQGIADLDSDSSTPAIQCRLHFEPTRDALIRSHYWRFAAARQSLSQDTVDPDFQFDSQFILPVDFMYLKSVFGDNESFNENTRITFAIEGQRLLTNEDSVDIRYIRKVTDPTEFDPLFVQVFAKQLALKLVSLAGANSKIRESLKDDLKRLMPQVRALDRQETNTIGRASRRPWLEARVQGGNTGLSQATVR